MRKVSDISGESCDVTRRSFLQKGGVALSMLPFAGHRSFGNNKQKESMMEIVNVNANFEREPLIRPFGFKGGYLSELWQSVSLLESSGGHQGVGLCTQSVLWSDASVFSSNSEAGGNALMYAITERGMQMTKGMKFNNPVELLEQIHEELYEYGQKVTNNPSLRKTFILNALVGLDNAAWMIYARERGVDQFDDLIPAAFKPALSYRHKKVASIPLMAYTIPVEEMRQAVDDGYFFMKIKIGQPGTQEEMLARDKERLSAIHKTIGSHRTPYTDDGKLPYYFDANGRYESKDTLLRLLDHARKIGAYDQIAVIEEPFPEEAEIDVHDIEMRIAADESAHTDKDAIQRIEMGYTAIALKAIAKTMSMTMKIAQAAYERNVPCFCADLTVNPVLVEWNKMVAARLAPFPGLGMGLLETNGHQNYLHWDQMRQYQPYPDASWSVSRKGIFELDEDFYDKNGGILINPKHYQDLVTKAAVK